MQNPAYEQYMHERCQRDWERLSPKQKIREYESKILGHLDATCQAFDLEEIMSVGFSDTDRGLCWNAAMNLVEQGRVHLIQIRQKNSSAVRWVIIGFEYVIQDNSEFLPPEGDLL